MQNWEVVKKKISELKKEDFIKFIRHTYCVSIGQLLGTSINCSKGGCLKCMDRFMKEEYQPPKQEKWIVHRTLRTENTETYIGVDDSNIREFSNFGVTYNKDKANKVSFDQAVLWRDILNKDRVGKQYLWIVSKVEE